MNLLPSERIEIRLNVVLLQYVDELMMTGLYGNNRQAVIERLICQGVERKLSDNFIRRLHWDGGEVVAG